MHFCYGFGAFVSPMIAEPFLLNEDCTPFIGRFQLMTNVFQLYTKCNLLQKRGNGYESNICKHSILSHLCQIDSS